MGKEKTICNKCTEKYDKDCKDRRTARCGLKAAKKEAKRLKEEAEMMQVLRNCQNSMCQVFAEQVAVDRLVEEDFMEKFAESPEYAAALEAFKKRFEAERGME
ncbi:MAG: hypothetical protein E7Z72_01370 [Methanocorpusculum parvum]|nr:hypothetical protein [Methanocorpusculum parvum]